MSREVPPPPPAPNPGAAARLLTGGSLDEIEAQLHAGEPTLRVTIAGVDHLVSADPDVVRHVLHANADNYVKDMALMAPFRGLLGDGLLTSEGPLWRSQRTLLARAFRAEALRGALVATRLAVDRAGDTIDEHARRGAAVDLGALARRLTLQVIAGATLSLDPDACDELARHHDAVVAEANRRVWLPLRASLPIPARARHDESLRALTELLSVHIDARRRAPNQPARDILDVLLAGADPWTAGAAKLVGDELRTMLFAGHETTSAALTWTLHAVTREPLHFARLRASADELLGDNADPTLESVRRLDLAEAIIKEALRIYNVVPMIVRRAVADDRLAEHSILAGTPVMLHLQALHRDPRRWPDPTNFRPARFLGAQAPALPWLPFAGGPRNCLGQHLAMLELRYALALLARRFDFSADPANRDERHRFAVPVGPARPLHAHVTRRA